MFCLWTSLLACLSLTSVVASSSATPVSKRATSSLVDGALRYMEDSGICETTPGVKTYSGYIDIAANQSMWFWFFEARKNPEEAPFALWINGGPGCSSMIGLFQENGPCQVSADGLSTTLNPYSWNEYANMIYIDQPISTGFSYGIDNVNTTEQAAPPVWTFFQLLFTSGKFNKYKSREFGLWTESYGGHYGPAFSDYFLAQNTKIASGQLKGEQINLMALGINNGWFDPLIQNEAYYDFAQAKYNGYFDIVNSTVLEQVKKSLFDAGGCKELEQLCYQTGKDDDCRKADDYCIANVFAPAIGNQDSYYILRNATDPFPSESYLIYLNNTDVKAKIGAESQFQECPDAPYQQFVPSGDDARSSIPALTRVLNTGMRTLIWAGDLDYNCNWLGGYRAIEQMQWSSQKEFNETGWSPLQYEGTVWGTYKGAGNMSFVKIFGSGHEVPAYKPEISLELFRQTMMLQAVNSDI